MKYDLHVHTNKSDGEYSRLNLINRLNNKLEYISFTDHNYIENIDEYTNYIKDNNLNIKLINGVEFDISDYKFLHILAYGIKDIKIVSDKLNEISKKNIEICKRLIESLKKNYKFDISYDEIIMSGKKLSKGTIRNLLVKKGYAENNKIAGDLYTGRNSLNYEKTTSLNLEETLGLIKSSGGISLLAHPSTLKLADDKLYEFIIKMKEMGLDGLEVLNTSKTTKIEFEKYRNIAKKLNLIESCGSDYHNDLNTPNIGVENEISKKLIYRLERWLYV